MLPQSDDALARQVERFAESLPSQQSPELAVVRLEPDEDATAVARLVDDALPAAYEVAVNANWCATILRPAFYCPSPAG